MSPPTYQHGAQPFNMHEMDNALPVMTAPSQYAGRQPPHGPADFFPQATAPYAQAHPGHGVPPHVAVPFQNRDAQPSRQHGYQPQLAMSGPQIHGALQSPSMQFGMYYPHPTANITHPYGVSPGAIGHVGSFYPPAPYYSAHSPAVGRKEFGHSPQGSPQSTSGALASPRGPPRKPKQSGHALWVGNLPPAADIADLKDHFARDATKEIESLFLIAKSNCAFVNYRSEQACVAAMHRFHDSRFHGVRLVCRLRKGATSIAATQSTETGLNPPDGRSVPYKLEIERTSTPIIVVGTPSPPSDDKDTHPDTPAANANRVPEKFFILKSLTLQDLEASVRKGEWTTQLHNEAALNDAFDSADNVYLIFSANKSGEYFGYARMLSRISGNLAATPAPTIQRQISPEDGPRSIPTPSTESAPPGRIIDDSARGTIFWEADDMVDEDGGLTKERTPEDLSTGEQDLGRPFKIEWITTNRLPFFRTRGLRNPWNANREVKIARDGTELEPGVGKRLLPLFHTMMP